MSTAVISLLSGLAGMFGWGIYDFFAGLYSKKIGPYKTFFWSQLAGVVPFMLLIPLMAGALGIPAAFVGLLFLAALVYSAGYLFFMKGFEIGNISIIAAIMNLWAVFTMFNAFVFMGQRLSLPQTAGAFMIIAGAILASLRWSDLKHNRFQLSAGVKEAISGAFFFGVFWNISEIVSEKIGWLLTTVCVKLGIVLFMLFFSFLLKRKLVVEQSTTRTKMTLVFMGIIEAGAVAAVNFGLTIGDAILITPISSALSVVTITMAIVILKDRITRLQGLGMVTAVLGIIVTAF